MAEVQRVYLFHLTGWRIPKNQVETRALSSFSRGKKDKASALHIQEPGARRNLCQAVLYNLRTL